MIEPTESYTKAELDRFSEAVVAIIRLIREHPQTLLSAPHFTPIDRVEEVEANRDVCLSESLEELPFAQPAPRLDTRAREDAGRSDLRDDRRVDYGDCLVPHRFKPIMVPAFIIALAVGVAALYWIILRNASARIAAQYQKLSERLGLELHLPPPSLGGFIRSEPSVFGAHAGREVSISVPGKGMQNTRQIETVLKLELKRGGFNAQLAAAGLFGGLRQRDSVSSGRWKSGQAAFDAAVDVRTDAGARMAQVLTDARREWVMQTIKPGRGRFTSVSRC